MKSTLVTILSVALASLAHAISPGQIDDFQDGTTQSWANGGISGVPPVLNITDGGPGGLGDHYMQISSTGSGVGSRLTVFNRNQWLGDYLGQGITTIEMDLNNQGAIDLSIRIGFKQTIGPGSPGYVSPAFFLPVGSGWQHVVFTINMATMIALNSPDNFNSFFSGNFSEFRIINSVNPDLNGDRVIAQLGIDNVHAVPEPTIFALATTGLLGLIAIRRLKHRAKSRA